MGERSGRDRESLLMVCHGVDPVRQLALHVLMRPSYSFLDICGPIPVDYLDGELILPLFLPNNKVFARPTIPRSMWARSVRGSRPRAFILRTDRRPQASSRASCGSRRPTTRQART